MRAAEAAAGRAAGSVQLLAVTKTFGASVVAAAARLGQQRFGENYAQEGIAKMDVLRACPDLPALEWHFIGPIQSNKTRLIATRFDWVQSIDRANIAQRLSDQRPPELAPLQALIEVNISGEASKSGVPPAQLIALALAIGRLPGLRLRGLMAIPEPGRDMAAQRAAFVRLRSLLDAVSNALAADPERGAGTSRPDILSMGMSADFEVAIAEGSTMVRVGSAIFGERT
jgi:pyridoxal phosphate enzyme (YggS family)